MTRILYIGNFGVPSLEFTGGISNIPSQSSREFSISSVPIGSAASRKHVIVHVLWSNSNVSAPIESASIGGVAASVLVDTVNYPRSAIIIAPVSTGPTATVNIQFGPGGGTYFLALFAYKALKLKSATPVDVNTTVANNVTTTSVDVDVKKDGFVILAGGLYSNNTFSLVNVAENYETIWASDTNHRAIGGHDGTSADQSGYTITVNRDSTLTTFNARLAAASFR